MLTIAIDAMGGDFAPAEVVAGTIRAARSLSDCAFVLVGDEDVVRGELASHGWSGDRITIVHAPETIDMGEIPVEALRRKPRASIPVAVSLVATKQASAFVSAGNTGACVAACVFGLGRLAGVRRPGIAVTFRTQQHPVVLMDVGANISCKAEDLYQYAVMASLYAETVLSIRNPKIGLLNIGSEEAKGTALAVEANALFQRRGLNYCGNVEGGDVFRGVCDVVVCEGFVGNIVLKISEGLAETVFDLFRNELERVGFGAEAIRDVREALHGFRERIDYAEQGGAPLLGVNGTAIICHGRSHARAIGNAIGVARRMVSLGLDARIVEGLGESSRPNPGMAG